MPVSFLIASSSRALESRKAAKIEQRSGGSGRVSKVVAKEFRARCSWQFIKAECIHPLFASFWGSKVTSKVGGLCLLSFPMMYPRARSRTFYQPLSLTLSLSPPPAPLPISLYLFVPWLSLSFAGPRLRDMRLQTG